MEMPTAPPAVAIAPGAVPTTRETAAIVGHFPPPRRVLPGTGLQVFPIALCGKAFGTLVSDAASIDILDTYTALGGNLVDTADSYGDGRSEELIGEWMARRGNRDELVLATKVGRSRENPGLSARAIQASVDASSRRLGTERIDVLYLHVDDESVPFEETLLALDELVRDGRIGAFGMSDHTGNRLVAARIACGLLGIVPMTVLQNRYSLMHREFEGELARVAAQQELAIMPRFPLADGFLTGAFRSKVDLVASPEAAFTARHLGRRGRRVLATLDRVAAAHGAAPATIALAWLLSKHGVVAPVVPVASAAQVFDVLSAPDIRLTRHQLAELDRVSA